jgi:integrase/recombinase XerD
MTTAAPSTALVTIQPAFTDPERLGLAGFLAGYRGLTRGAYALGLRQFTALDRNELGALLVAAGLGSPVEHALISLLALNGLRVSEATGADIEHLGVERGHRTLTITRKGGKVVTIPLAPRTARAIDLAVGERCDGPVFLTADGRGLDRHGAGRIVRRVARRAGITKPVGPHTLRHAFITAALDAGVPLRDVQEAASHADPRTTMRYDRARGSLGRHATYIVAAFIAGAAR